MTGATSRSLLPHPRQVMLPALQASGAPGMTQGMTMALAWLQLGAAPRPVMRHPPRITVLRPVSLPGVA